MASLGSVCRLCANPIPANNSETNLFVEQNQYLKLIRNYFRLQLNFVEKLPTKICEHCIFELENITVFKERCIRTQKSLELICGKSYYVLTEDNYSQPNENGSAIDNVSATSNTDTTSELDQNHERLVTLNPSVKIVYKNQKPESIHAKSKSSTSPDVVEQNQLVTLKPPMVPPTFQNQSPVTAPNNVTAAGNTNNGHELEQNETQFVSVNSPMQLTYQNQSPVSSVLHYSNIQPVGNMDVGNRFQHTQNQFVVNPQPVAFVPNGNYNNNVSPQQNLITGMNHNTNQTTMLHTQPLNAVQYTNHSSVVEQVCLPVHPVNQPLVSCLDSASVNKATASNDECEESGSDADSYYDDNSGGAEESENEKMDLKVKDEVIKNENYDASESTAMVDEEDDMLVQSRKRVKKFEGLVLDQQMDDISDVRRSWGRREESEKDDVRRSKRINDISEERRSMVSHEESERENVRRSTRINNVISSGNDARLSNNFTPVNYEPLKKHDETSASYNTSKVDKQNVERSLYANVNNGSADQEMQKKVLPVVSSTVASNAGSSNDNTEKKSDTALLSLIPVSSFGADKMLYYDPNTKKHFIGMKSLMDKLLSSDAADTGNNSSTTTMPQNGGTLHPNNNEGTAKPESCSRPIDVSPKTVFNAEAKASNCSSSGGNIACNDDFSQENIRIVPVNSSTKRKVDDDDDPDYKSRCDLKLQCQICDRTFKNNRSLQEHVKRHRL